MNWSAEEVGSSGSGLALAIDAAARVRHTHKPDHRVLQPSASHELVSWGPFVCVSSTVGQPNPIAIANANPNPPTSADREVPIHEMVGFRSKPLCFCGSVLQVGSQLLHVQVNIRAPRGNEVSARSGTGTFSPPQAEKIRVFSSNGTGKRSRLCTAGWERDGKAGRQKTGWDGN